MLVFPNPHHIRAANFDKWNGTNYARHQDKYAYEIEGRVFTHPTLPGAVMMSTAVERHAEVFELVKPNFVWGEFCRFCGCQND